MKGNVCERKARKGTLKCKHGPLAQPNEGRCCRKPPKRKRVIRRKCKHGLLKNPVKGRVCRRRPASAQLMFSFQGRSRRRRR